MIGPHMTLEEARRAHLAAIIDSSDDAIIGNDLDGIIRSWNPGASRLYGYTEEEAIGRPISMLIPDDQAEGLAEIMDRIRRDERVGHHRTIRQAKDGRRLNVSLTISPIKDSEGRIVGASAVARDISEQVRSEQALRESEERTRHLRERLETLLDRVPIGVALVDAELRVQAISPVGASVAADSPDRLVGRALEDILSAMWGPDDAEEVLRIVRHTLETGEPHHAPEFEVRRTDRDVTEYYDWRAERITLAGGRDGVVSYFHDISEQVQARKAIVESEARYRTLFESIDQGFCILEMIFDDDGHPIDYRFVEINPSFAKHTGISDGLGRTIRELVPDHEAFWFDIYGNVALTGEPARFVEHAAAMARWFDVEAFRVGDPELRRVAVLFTDVTERKRTEEALREADRRKDQFLATLAHELRNPLGAIRTAMGAMGSAKDDPTLLDELAEIVDRQSSHLVRMIDDLMDLSRTSLGKVRLERKRVDLAGIVRQVVADSAAMFREKGVTLSMALPDEPVVADADPVRFAQVVNNLRHNAWKFTPKGGEVRVTVRRDEGDAVVGIADTGAGMTPEQLSGVFEMFTQFGVGKGRGTEGLGIGLSLAKSIMELHGGTIEARSDGPGRGSEFVLRLPLAEDPALDGRSADGRPAPAASHPTGRRIVVAEDNQDALFVMTLTLRTKGHEVESAADGARALELARTFRPEVALLDIGMPGMDGYEVARAIRREPWGRDVLLIAMTGWGRDEDKRSAREAGFDVHLTKPVNLDRLHTILESFASDGHASGGHASDGH